MRAGCGRARMSGEGLWEGLRLCSLALPWCMQSVTAGLLYPFRTFEVLFEQNLIQKVKIFPKNSILFRISNEKYFVSFFLDQTLL